MLQVCTVRRIVALSILWLALPGCDRAPSGAREWVATDHDQAEGPGAPKGVPPSGSTRPTAGADPELIDVAWQQNCAKCHGTRGRGDGPEGMMVRAPDLTRAEWQGRVSDQEIADTIRKGRNKMPAFSLPPAVLDGLVRRIRRGAGRD